MSNSKDLALVVDDNKTNRMILGSLLKKNGYDIVCAENGGQAVDIFATSKVDIVFMDVMMPVMDGYEATRRIKEISKDYFIPVIFLTALNDEKSLAKCIEAGGDDFISKPYSITVLKSKINAIERIRDMSRKISSMYARIQNDEEIAEKVFSTAVLTGNIENKAIKSILKSADIFSGDIFISAYSPCRDINLLLGDFTGHGLSAALGALPVSEVFRTMTSKGFAPGEILNTINTKLHNLLPAGMFMACQLVNISNDLDSINIYNCGMPPVYLKQNDKVITFESSALALGINREHDYSRDGQRVAVEYGDHVILASDGVSESVNEAGDAFGDSRLYNLIEKTGKDDFICEYIIDDLDRFCGKARQHDDISIAEIIIEPKILPIWDVPVLSKQLSDSINLDFDELSSVSNAIEFSINLYGRNIRSFDPVPHVVNDISQTISSNDFDQAFFIILTELYVNAVDYGVLELDSSQKNTPGGFAQYFKIRKERLNNIHDGYIKINVKIMRRDQGFFVTFRIEDSGKGFDISRLSFNKKDKLKLFGRGINLVANLCAAVHYEEPGNIVEATYICV